MLRCVHKVFVMIIATWSLMYLLIQNIDPSQYMLVLYVFYI